MNWGGLSNGSLLQKAEEEFDVLLTGDTNLSFQQNVTNFDIGVIVLDAESTRLADTIRLIPLVLELLAYIQSGEVIRVGLKD